MGPSMLDHVWRFLTSVELSLALLWAGLAAISVTLLVLMRTRWGQSQPLRKCFVLSLLAHLLLAGYATTVQIVSQGPRASGESTMLASLVDQEQTSDDSSAAPPDDAPWNQLLHEDVLRSQTEDLVPENTSPPPEPERQIPPREPASDEKPESTTLPGMAEPQPDQTLLEPVEPHPALARQAEQLDAPKPEHRESPALSMPEASPSEEVQPAPVDSLPPRETPGELPSELMDAAMFPARVAEEADSSDSAELVRDVVDLPAATPRGSPVAMTPEPTAIPATSSADATEPSLSLVPVRDNTDAGSASKIVGAESGTTPHSIGHPLPTAHEVPETLQLRVSPNRSSEALRRGATERSEAAVAEALKWLAANQEPDGRWDASRHGAGREIFLAGQNRKNAGIDADSGMTGLALLAFLAAGNTHRQGDYQDTVRRGLDFLVAGQRSDGYLAGEATSFAAMYCHAMATLAVSEAYAMTGDPRLEPAVRRAVHYTRTAQDPRGGGWRYVPGDAGDMSQFGWQIMALRSAELAGIPLPDSTRNDALRFLSSISSGRHRGLGAYRPGQPATTTMTAESLYCRQLLGMPPESPTAAEAADYLLGELPGLGQANVYYWYYATLALYQVQGERWQQWNEALQKALVTQQCDSGTLAGSWDPDATWGSYGGRVYSTALATLCLEVYYRYLPLNLEMAGKSKSVR